MSSGVVVIGLGNAFRRDDGVGIAAATALGDCAGGFIRVVTDVSDSVSLLDAWDGAVFAVVIDGAVTAGSEPGKIRQCGPDELAVTHGRTSSHRLDLAQAIALGRALERMPDALVLLVVDIADVGYGEGLTPAVAAAVPKLVAMAAAEINRHVR
ncbi:MAG: hydrogenase maturation protease [Mycobacterium sp.]